jgi:chaperonin GroEL
LEHIAQTGKKNLIIIADDVEGEALTTFVLNKLRGSFNVLAIKAPGFGDRKKELLEDIATTIGAKVVSEETGMKLESVGSEVLGSARKVIATKDKTVIVGGKGKKADITARANQLKNQIANTESKFEPEKLEERIAKLSGGVAVIKVGAATETAATETEMKYLKLKIEDAVNATKAAIEEGIVPGGGVALVKAAEATAKKKLSGKSREEEVGYQIVLKALEAPLKQIAINAGKDDGAVIVEEIKKAKGSFGYDAQKDAMVEDMFAAGIIDPVKVTRSGVQHAASAAAVLLTTEVAVTDEPKKEEPNATGGMGGMPGMGY